MGLPKAAATIAITGDPDGLEKAIARSKGILSKFASGAKNLLGGAGGLVGGAFGKLGGLLGRAFDPLGKAYQLVGDATDDVMTFERGIARLAISQGKTNEEMGAFRAQISDVSEKTGVARNDILKAQQAYQALTGDTKGASAAMSTFARVAQATGSNVDDIAKASAALSQQFGILPQDFEKAFSVLNVQGKAGAVELHDWASLLASLSAQSKHFKGGLGVEGLQKTGSALQVMAQAFGGNSSEAATGFAALMTAMVKNAGKLEKAGIKIYDRDPKTGKKNLRGFADIVDEIQHSKLIKDPTLLSKALGGRGEALRALQALTDNWGQFQTMVNTTDFKSIGKDLNQYLNSPAGKLDKTWNDMKLAIAEAFTPERINKFAAAMEKVSKVVGPVADALGFIADKISDAADASAALGTAAGKAVFGDPNDDVIAYDQAEHDKHVDRGETYNPGTGNWEKPSVTQQAATIKASSAGARPSAADRAMIAKILADGQKKPVQVNLHIDGDKVATAHQHAAKHRRHP